MLIAAAAMTFTSCQKEDKAQVNNGEGTVKVNFTSVADGTKTYFGDRITDNYPTLWTGDEQVGITYVDANIDKDNNVVTVSGKGQTTTFSTELTAVDGAATVYVFAPWYSGDFKDKNAGGFTNYNGTKKNANVVIPTKQISTPNSCDPRAQLLVAKYDFKSGVEENVAVSFTHATAYGKVTIKGVDTKIKTVKIDFGQNVTGTGIYYYTADNETYKAKAGDLKAGASYNQTYVEIDNSNNACDKTFWFGIPAISCEGKTVVVTVTDENDKEYTKAITSDAKVLKFEQGRVSSFTVTVAPKSDEKTYISIKDLRAKGEKTITDNLCVKGYVISDASSNNFHEQNLVISDGEAGITVRFSAKHSYTTIGQEVEVDLNGLTLSKYNGLLQINNVPAGNVHTTTNTKVLEPKEITVEQLLSGNYESMYVLIKDVQVTNNDLQKKLTNSINMEQRDGGKFVMYFRKDYVNASKTVPQGCGNLMGIASIHNGTKQIIPNNEDDYAGLTGTRFGDAPALEFVTATFSATTFKEGVEIADGKITLTYKNASSENVNCAVTVSGEAASGIGAPATSDVLAKGDGTLVLDVYGTPAKAGSVTFNIKITKAGETEPLYTGSVNATVASASTSDSPVYTSNVTLTPGTKGYKEKIKIDGVEYDCLKMGTSKLTGNGILSGLNKTGDATLSFYAYSWKGKPSTLKITVKNGGTINGSDSITTNEIASNDGATDNNPYILKKVDNSALLSFTLKDLTSKTEISVETVGTNTRVLIFGVNIQ